jgi:predicted transcriptional regulator
MSDILNSEKNFVLCIENEQHHKMLAQLSRALAVPERILILQKLLNTSKSLSALAEELNMPLSSVSRHVDVLAAAGLIYVNYQPGPKGHTKFCSQAILNYTVSLESSRQRESNTRSYSVEMPIGMFSDCNIKPPCGMVSAEGAIEEFDDPDTFFSPLRSQAECLWFDKGFVSYHFPAKPLHHHLCSEISFTFEICSETMYYNDKWPSDITISVNGIKLLTFTSPGDFGGRRGKYTPEYWPITSTQFGLLKKVTVTKKGVYLDQTFLHSNVKFQDLKLYEDNNIRLDIGIEEDAEHCGGINLFGKNFGDYPHAIVMTVK